MLSVTSTTAEKYGIRITPNGALEGPITVNPTSGDGKFESPTDADPTLWFVVSEEVAGATSYMVSAPAGGGTITDTIDYIYTLAPAEPATDLGLSAEGAVPK